MSDPEINGNQLLITPSTTLPVQLALTEDEGNPETGKLYYPDAGGVEIKAISANYQGQDGLTSDNVVVITAPDGYEFDDKPLSTNPDGSKPTKNLDGIIIVNKVSGQTPNQLTLNIVPLKEKNNTIVALFPHIYFDLKRSGTKLIVDPGVSVTRGTIP